MAKRDVSQKVGGTADKGGEGRSRSGERAAKTPFDIAGASAFVAIRDDDGNETGEFELSSASKDGKLIAVPRPIVHNEGDDMKTVVCPKKDDTVVFAGYDATMHKPLVKGDFVSEDIYIEWRAFVNRWRAAKLTRFASTLETRADRLRQFGDERTRKKADKLTRMREQMAALEAELKEQGVVLDEDEDA